MNFNPADWLVNLSEKDEFKFPDTLPDELKIFHDFLMEELYNNPASFVKKFIDMKVPENDPEYVEMLMNYFELLPQIEDILKDYIASSAYSMVDFTHHYLLTKEVLVILTRALVEKIKKIRFKPKLEKYLEERIPPEDRNYVRAMIIQYFLILFDRVTVHSISFSLFDLASYLKLPTEFIVKLSSDYPIIKDGVFIITSNDYEKDKIIPKREIGIHTGIYKLFVGKELTDEDFIPLLNTPILDFFNVESPDHIPQEEEYDKDVDTPFDEYELERLDQEDIDIEDIIKEVKQESKNLYISEAPTTLEEGEYPPFESDIDYLHAISEYMCLKYKIIQIKKDKISFSHDNLTEIKHLQAEYERKKRIFHIRLKKSYRMGFRPRLERLASRLKLTEFEKDVLKLLMAITVFSDSFKLSFSIGNSVSVGDILSTLLDNPLEEVKHRKFFFKDSRLTKYGLIHIFESENNIYESLFNYTVVLDNRIVEFLIGEEYNISSFIEGSYLYHPKVSMKNVILPKGTKENLLALINNFPSFLDAKKKVKFADVVEYGNALVLLFVGPSGTGKTLLANAIANYLGKRILLFNLNNYAMLNTLSSVKKDIFSLVFREARISDAILFFDESEALLAKRFHELLIEIEKHEGIVIFATNAIFKLDEAMRRRINLIVKLKNPGPDLREKIWEIHLPRGMEKSDDIDLKTLARRYELNGGLIKNAVFSAIASAVKRGTPPILTMDDLIKGAQEQLENKLYMACTENQRMPLYGIDSVVLSKHQEEQISELIELQKAKSVLHNELMTSEKFLDYSGIAALFYGPSGTGKTYTSEAIAYELGQNLRILTWFDVYPLFYPGSNPELVGYFLKSLTDENAIILFENADNILLPNEIYPGFNLNVGEYILRFLIRNNHFCIFTVKNIDGIPEELLRLFHTVVKFDKPDKALREKLWKKLLPANLTGSDINYEYLSERFDFTGQDIKDAIIYAAKKLTVGRKRKITMKDLENACKMVIKKKNYTFEKTVGF